MKLRLAASRRPPGVLIVAALVVGSGCASLVGADFDDMHAQGETSPESSTDASDLDRLAEDGAPQPRPDAATRRVFAGTLASSAKVAFGGPPKYCDYEITLVSIAVELTMLNGVFTAASVKDTATEKAIACKFAPSPPSPQQFSLQAATGNHLVLLGAPGITPATDLTMDLVPSSRGYMATLRWVRTDQAGTPLAWSVTASVLLEAR